MIRPRILISILLAGGLSAQVASPGSEPQGRSFHMGFTAFPFDLSSIAQELTYDFVADHADLITFHMDGGVPWPEALTFT